MTKLLPASVYMGANYATLVEKHARAFPPTLREETLTAYVNEGRWVADCPNCGSGIALTLEWPYSHCFGMACGAIYARVAWPLDGEAIEGALVLRPRRNQFWRPGETVEDLLRENAEHGVAG